MRRPALPCFSRLIRSYTLFHVASQNELAFYELSPLAAAPFTFAWLSDLTWIYVFGLPAGLSPTRSPRFTWKRLLPRSFAENVFPRNGNAASLTQNISAKLQESRHNFPFDSPARNSDVDVESAHARPLASSVT